VRVYSSLRKFFRQWLLRTLQPCRKVVPLMSESLERRLSPHEWFSVHLHLLVCAWCARYLKQIKFLRSLLRGHRATSTELVPSLAADARARIAAALQNRER
jgi:hypothetical protein